MGVPPGHESFFRKFFVKSLKEMLAEKEWEDVDKLKIVSSESLKNHFTHISTHQPALVLKLDRQETLLLPCQFQLKVVTHKLKARA